MEVGLALPQFEWEGAVAWDAVVAAARHAEELDFASVWLADHLFLDPARYGFPPGRAFGHSPITGLAAVARATRRVRLGTLVICPQLRPPTVTAKMLATVDQLAGGRLIVGVGAGWFEPEFEEAGIPFERPGVRVRQLEDAVRTYRGMWRGDPAYPPCRLGPWSSGGPPIWVGGQGDRTMEIAARLADGFSHQGWRSVDGPNRFAEFFETCERVGRERHTIHLSAVHAVMDFDALADELATLAGFGVATVVVGIGQLPFSLTGLEAIDRIAAAVAELP